MTEQISDIQKHTALRLVQLQVRKSLGLPGLPDPSQTPAYLGMDSLGFIELVMDLEVSAHKDFNLGDMSPNEHNTIQEIADYVAQETM